MSENDSQKPETPPDTPGELPQPSSPHEDGGFGGKWVNRLKESFRQFDPSHLAEWASSLTSGQGGQNGKLRSTAFYLKLGTVIICTYFFADLAALILSRYIPEPPPAVPARGFQAYKRAKTVEDYNPIIARNLVNSRGIIPGEETPGGDLGGPPVRTTLPINLIGTLILRDELRSIATIEDRSASQVFPVRVNDEIPAKARIIKIEPRRVIFVNTSSGRREFIELPEESGINPRVTLGGPARPRAGGGGIEQVAPNTFSVSRQEVDKQLADLNNILTQARAVPNFENGVPNGFKFFQIVPGSIYSKLGLENGDVVTAVNGQAINDPAKAFELLNQLKESSRIEIQKKRNGRPVTTVIDIN